LPAAPDPQVSARTSRRSAPWRSGRAPRWVPPSPDTRWQKVGHMWPSSENVRDMPEGQGTEEERGSTNVIHPEVIVGSQGLGSLRQRVENKRPGALGGEARGAAAGREPRLSLFSLWALFMQLVVFFLRFFSSNFGIPRISLKSPLKTLQLHTQSRADRTACRASTAV
jgi:hypothetical protein